jgi:hypothetical protein
VRHFPGEAALNHLEDPLKASAPSRVAAEASMNSRLRVEACVVTESGKRPRRVRPNARWEDVGFPHPGLEFGSEPRMPTIGDKSRPNARGAPTLQRPRDQRATGSKYTRGLEKERPRPVDVLEHPIREDHVCAAVWKWPTVAVKKMELVDIGMRCRPWVNVEFEDATSTASHLRDRLSGDRSHQVRPSPAARVHKDRGARNLGAQKLV